MSAGIAVIENRAGARIRGRGRIRGGADAGTKRGYVDEFTWTAGAVRPYALDRPSGFASLPVVPRRRIGNRPGRSPARTLWALCLGGESSGSRARAGRLVSLAQVVRWGRMLRWSAVRELDARIRAVPAMARSARGQPGKSRGGSAAGLDGPNGWRNLMSTIATIPAPALPGGCDLREVFRGVSWDVYLELSDARGRRQHTRGL